VAAPRAERRLAAILAADVVGYSRLMERDERGTLARLKAFRAELVEPLIAEHRGRIVKLMGDGILCEFASAVDAVECAVAVQDGMAEREADLLEDERVRLRIGINLGDVIVEPDGDLYGDGVNIAARLEQLAPPGGAVLSGTAFDQVEGKLGLAFEPLGEQRVKNIERPVRAYRVGPGPATAPAWRAKSRRGEVTVVFCDLRGFTAFAEAAAPEAVMGVLREYHAALVPLVHRFEGTLERFVGDGLVVLFNAPLPCPDPAARAVRMALAMRDAVRELAAGWRGRGFGLGFGVGIAQGEATLGRIGFEGRYDYAAIGRVANLGARLCAEARDGQILVSGPVAEAVAEVAVVDALGPVTLKGFETAVPVFAVAAARA
jgi:class 3 adenylate cyclase